MTSYFHSENAAERYDAYRPRVHDVVLEWLRECLGERRFRNAIDIACGTGHSTLPLAAICDSVLGIDRSAPMLAFAAAHGIDTRFASYEDLAEVASFDLITTCMAFHWFDPESALAKYKQISTDGAIWLIYNFYFAGHEHSKDFNRWLREEYLGEYPSPPRNRTEEVLPNDDPEIELLRADSGTIPVSFSDEELVGYLTTQTNIEHAVARGATYPDVSERLLSRIRELPREGRYRYNYTYEIYRYRRR